MAVANMPKEKPHSDMPAEDDGISNAKDRGGRRRVPDRRQFSSSDHFPERRNLRHRRSGNDRRNLLNQKRRKKIERRRMFKEKFGK
jgi:hypothetical protein